MPKKRLIGLINVKDNLSVQSMGYNFYLPLGKPEIAVKNLNNWGVDEILINFIDRSIKKQGPNFEKLNQISKLGISTPLIYGGGIRSYKDAIKVINNGADRILIDYLLHKNLNEVKKISNIIGAQAIIASLPIINIKNKYFLYNYISGDHKEIDKNIIELFSRKIIFEALVIDKNNEGKLNSFNSNLVNIPELKKVQKILFGGITKIEKMKKLLGRKYVSAIAIGNYLNYSENSTIKISNQLKLRKPIIK